MAYLYQHTQLGYVILIALGIAVLALLISFFAISVHPVTLVVLPILLASLLMFGSLTIQVGMGDLRWSFGPGLIRQTVRVADITAVRAVENPWYYGWGIRLTPHGLLYNVSGSHAVEIHLKNGKQLRLGTDQPEALIHAIETARESNT